MSMGIGVRAGSARVGVVPTSSGGSSAARGRRASSIGIAIQGTGDSDSDYEGNGDGDGDSSNCNVFDKGPHGPNKASNSSRSSGTSTSNFPQIPVKNSELKEKLRAMGAGRVDAASAAAAAVTTGTPAPGARGGVSTAVGSGTRASLVLPSQRRKQEQREKRRTSVLLSLAMLDVNDDADDDHHDNFLDNAANSGDSGTGSPSEAHVGAPLQPCEPEPKGRYLRRGSVTKHQLVPNVDAMQPSLHTPRATAVTTHPSHSDLPPAADCEPYEPDVSANGYASDSYGYASDTSVSNSHLHLAMSHKRRQSSAATLGAPTAPPLTSQNAQSHSRYLRRGSVTRHKLNPPIGSMQPTHHRPGDDGYSESHENDRDDSSVVSMPPLSSSASYSQSSDTLPPRQKYNRRGSVTKFSLDSYLQNPTHTKGLQGERKPASSNIDYGYNDDNDSGSVVSMPPLSSSASYSQSSDTLPARQKYKRRGSVTKFSLDSYLQNPAHTKGLQGERKPASSNIDYGYNDDNDNGSVVSMPPLSSSASYSQSSDTLPPRQKYKRRGSVTKFSLDSYLQNPAHTKGLQGEGKPSSSNVDYGYNDDNDNASVVSMPPLSSSASHSQASAALPPRQKYKRRGSVTKFSLDPSQAIQNNAAALQPSDEKQTNHVASYPLAPPAGQNHPNDYDSDTDSDSENDTRPKPKPKPGDDDYSENLENSGRFLRRSISISAETDDIQSNAFTDSKIPPLPGAHSASSAIPNQKPPKKQMEPRGGNREVALDTNHINLRTINDVQTPSRPPSKLKSALEDDSGHVKKSWYPQTSVTRRDSMSSLDSETSEAEFGSEIVESQRKQRSPPLLPPQTRRGEASRPNDSISSQPREPITGKTTINGHASSVSPDGIASACVHSDDEDSNALPSRRTPLRARRSSIVGIPSSDTGYSSLDDSLSPVAHDEGLPTPKPTKMRARRASIVGIPTIDPPSPPSNTLATDDPKEKIPHTGPISSGNPESAKTKKKSTTKAKLPTQVKKSFPNIASNSSPSLAIVTSHERRACLKASDATGTAKKVRFGHLVITEFPIILGDNPAVTSGAPVTIDWTPQKETRLSINAYEQCKPRRRRRRKLLISVSNRAILLLAAGYSIDEIADASIDAQQIKLGRQQTLDNQSWDSINHMIETTGDAIGGMFLQPLQITGKKLKSLVVKPQQHSASARMA